MTDENRLTLQDIKERHPLQEILPRYLSLRSTGAYLVGCCPFHDDRSPSFAAYLQTQTWQCFAASCGLGGDVIDFVGCQSYGAAWNNRDPTMFKEALRRLASGELPPLRQPVPETWRKEAAWRPIEITPRAQMLLHTAASLYHTTLLARGRGPSSPYAYLRDARGFSDDTIRREGLGYAEGGLLLHALAVTGFTRADAEEIHLVNTTGGESMTGRIVFIECDRTGRVLHLIGRKFASWLGESAPKYLSLKEMAKPLYGYAQLDKRQSDQPVLLMESPPDALTARQWGWAALANTGTQLKFDHAARLTWLRRPLVIVPHNDGETDLDGARTDGPGWQAAEKWLQLIGQGKIVPLPDGIKDLNELGVKRGGEKRFEAQLKQFGFERPAPVPRPRSRRHFKTQAELLLDNTPLWSSL